MFSHLGIHHYNRALFEFCNEHATFQRAKDILLPGVQWKKSFIYKDNVVIFLKDSQQHVKNIDEVPKLISHARVTLVQYFRSVNVSRDKFQILATYSCLVDKPLDLGMFMMESKPLSSRHTAHKWDYYWVHATCTEDPSNIFLKSLKHSAPIYGITKNWIGRTPGLRILTPSKILKCRRVEPLVLTLLQLDGSSTIDTDAWAHTLSAAAFNNKTTEIWTCELRMAARAECTIIGIKLLGNRMKVRYHSMKCPATMPINQRDVIWNLNGPQCPQMDTRYYYDKWVVNRKETYHT